jgi:transcriptional regulator with XRE-family HTH domain
METEVTFQNKHLGRNIKNLREMLGIKQESLAESIGFSQQYVSILETQEKIDENILEKIAYSLQIPVDVVKNFNEEQAINIISSTFQDESVGGHITHYKCTFNPLDKVIELCEQNVKLYERLLKEKDEQIQLLKERR